VFKLLKHTVHQ